MTNSAIEQVLQRGLWWHCDDDVTGLTWFNAALEYWLLIERIERDRLKMWQMAAY